MDSATEKFLRYLGFKFSEMDSLDIAYLKSVHWETWQCFYSTSVPYRF